MGGEGKLLMTDFSSLIEKLEFTIIMLVIWTSDNSVAGISVFHRKPVVCDYSYSRWRFYPLLSAGESREA